RISGGAGGQALSALRLARRSGRRVAGFDRLFRDIGRRRAGKRRCQRRGAQRTRLVAGTPRTRRTRRLWPDHRAGLQPALWHRQRRNPPLGCAAGAGHGLPRRPCCLDDRGRLERNRAPARCILPPSQASHRRQLALDLRIRETLMATDLPAREAMEFDVVIVGAGPAGLAAAIRLKRINPEISVVVVEKGSEVGAHILSGAVIDPIAIDRLLPGWRDEDSPIKTKVSADRFYYLTASNALRLPNILMPPLMSNHGNFIVSLGEVCRFLGQKAESLGVEIYPGFAAAEVLFDANGAVAGVATGDMGIGKDGKPKENFTRGMELRAKYTLFAEGARGNLSKILLARFGLERDREP